MCYGLTIFTDMKNFEGEYKKRITKKIVEELKKNNLSAYEIKARYVDEEVSKGTLSVTSYGEHVPDLEIKMEQGSIIYSIEIGNNLDINKWKALSESAYEKGDRYYIIVSEELKEEVLYMTKEAGINAGVLYFEQKQ